MRIKDTLIEIFYVKAIDMRNNRKVYIERKDWDKNKRKLGYFDKLTDELYLESNMKDRAGIYIPII